MFKKDFITARKQIIKEIHTELELYLKDNLSSHKEIDNLKEIFTSLYLKMDKIESFINLKNR